MKTKVGWLRRGVWGLLASGGLLVLAIASGWGAAVWVANRDVPAPSLAQHRQSFERGLGWLRAHELEILHEGNAALWWMLQTAANVTHDPYLSDLVNRSQEIVYRGSRALVPWRRFLDPSAPFLADASVLNGAHPYQRFFYYAATCEPVEADEEAQMVRRYFTDNTCRPMLNKVLLSDTVCSTHQYMGLDMYKRARCPGSDKVDALQRELLADIERQMWLDPVFRDPYIQRVLVLQWFGDPAKVKPVWLRNVLDSQLADGGWNGERQFLGAPRWLQPWVLRHVLTGDFRQLRNPDPLVSGFHATAQGILLEALAIKQAGGANTLAKATP